MVAEFIRSDAVAVILFLLANQLFIRYVVKNSRNPKLKIYIFHLESAPFYPACLKCIDMVTT